MMPGMSTSRDIINEIGPKRVMARLGLSRRSVNEAAADGIPAKWYVAMCQLTGRALPTEAFTFRRLDAGRDE